MKIVQRSKSEVKYIFAVKVCNFKTTVMNARIQPWWVKVFIDLTLKNLSRLSGARKWGSLRFKNVSTKEFFGHIHVFHIKSCTERTDSFMYYFLAFGKMLA